MKKKSLIALLLACSFAFGTAAYAGCNVVGGDPGSDKNQTDTDNKNDDNKKPDGNKEDENKTPSQNPAEKDPNEKDPDDKDPDEKDPNEKDPDEKDPPKADRTVKFYSDGTLVDTKTVKDGEKVIAPTNVSKTGYSLTGWSTSAASGASFDFTNGVTSDLNLYAQWAPVNDKVSYLYAGNECAAFEWKDSNPAGAKVEYKLSTDSSYTRVDSALIRASTTSEIAGTARVDVVGLKGGANYDFKITPSNGSAFTVDNIAIASYDRSGYAHFNKTDGVGAYNDDGTPKSGAKIIYLTEANKNNIDGNGTSIAQYLKNAANNSTPIIIRVVGTVGSATWNLKDYGDQYGKESLGKTPLSASLVSQLTPRIDGGSGSLATSGEVTYYQDASSYGYKSSSGTLVGVYNTLNLHPTRQDGLYDNSECAAIKGLNSYMKVKNGEYDSCWNDCPISNVTNVTIEGIGEDAEIFQWGFTFKNSSSVEVRNIHFDDYTEDGCSFEGSDTGVSSLSSFSNGNIWLHHNTFDEGVNYWDVCAEQDKGDGDGSTDFKGLKNITIAYNHYIGTHKTGLIGGSDSVATASVTFHHNYYQSCNQRMPLGRQANMHMYNNYYSGSTLYSISLRAGAYAFIENCYFTEDASNHYPVELVSGSNGTPSAKIINCVISQSKVEDHNAVGAAYLYIGNDRNATVDTSDQRFAENFDTNSTLFYYDSANNKSKVTQMLTAEQTKELVPKLAGVQKRDGDVTLGGTGSGTGTGTETPNPNPNPGGDDTPTTATIVFTYSDFVSGTSATKDGITLTITSDISTDTSNKSTAVVYNGNNYGAVGNLYLSGGAKLTGDSPSKYIEFTTTKAFKITVVAKGGDGRKLHLVKDKTEVAVFGAGATQEMTTKTVNAGGTYRLGSTGSGVRVFYIIIEYV